MESGADAIRLVGILVVSVGVWYNYTGKSVTDEVWGSLFGIATAALVLDFLHTSGTGHQTTPDLLFATAVAAGLCTTFGILGGYVGWFGQDDIGLLIGVGLLYPTPPRYPFPTPGGVPDAIPIMFNDLGLFAIDIFTNIVLFGVGIHILLGVVNIIRGGGVSADMFSVLRAEPRDIGRVNGMVKVSENEYIESGILREYADWWDTDIKQIASNPDRYRDSDIEVPLPDGGTGKYFHETDEWAVIGFVSDVDTSVEPSKIRAGLDTVATGSVKIAPNVPYSAAILGGTILTIAIGSPLVALGALI